MDIKKELDRLTKEDYIFIIFIVTALLNIYGDQLLKKYIKEKNIKYKYEADKVYLLVIIITILVYIYFLKRNFIIFKNINNKINGIRLLGSIFLLIGSLCLLYFQLNANNNNLPSNI